jgi:two-component system sensor histidine kinase/response regulator
MEHLLKLLTLRLPVRLKLPWINSRFGKSHQSIAVYLAAIRSIGITEGMDEYEKRKLGVFNLLNFFQLLSGTIVIVAGIIYNTHFSALSWFIASLPCIVNIIVLILNANYRYHLALLGYFVLCPVLTCAIYLSRMDLGLDLFLILYGILSVFFFLDIGYMLFSVALSMMSYFVLFTIRKNSTYQPESVHEVVYITTQILAITYIIVALYLLKKENSEYQLSILNKNDELSEKNDKIAEQKDVIAEKVQILEKQAKGLRESNSVKNKLFSIISHDLKAPIFAIRNILQTAREQKYTAKKVKDMVPAIMSDLTYTTSLIENLLQWAKCQMQENTVRPQKLDLVKLINETVHLLHLQAEAKRITLEQKMELPVFAFADRDMIWLVIRNLLSNAIKFTPENGHIIIGAYESSSCVEVYVQDSGQGIAREDLVKINKSIFYTTKGTQDENGTGLGLMLCKEFLAKNEGNMMIESEVGKGSTFSFTLPLG